MNRKMLRRVGNMFVLDTTDGELLDACYHIDQSLVYMQLQISLDPDGGYED